DARRSVQQRGEDLQNPQQDIHRVPLSSIAGDDTRARRLDALVRLMHESPAVLRLSIVDVGAVTRRIDERLYRVLRGAARGELAVPVPRSWHGRSRCLTYDEYWRTLIATF